MAPFFFVGMGAQFQTAHRTAGPTANTDSADFSDYTDYANDLESLLH